MTKFIESFSKWWSAWIGLRPFVAVVFAFLFGVGVGVIGGMDLPLKVYWAMAGLFVGFLLLLAVIDWKKLTAAVMTATLIMLPTQLRSAPIVLGVGAGILIGGGVICVLVVKQCAKNKQHNNDAIKNLTNRTDFAQIRAAGQYADPNVYAGMQVIYVDYCSNSDFQAASEPEPEPQIGVTIPVQLTSSGEAVMGAVKIAAASDMVDWNTFKSTLESRFGITYSGFRGDTSYGVNGRPANETQVPFRVINGTMTIYPHLEQRILVLEERTNDYNPWSEISRVSAPVGHKILFSASTQSQSALYRVRVEQPSSY